MAGFLTSMHSKDISLCTRRSNMASNKYGMDPKRLGELTRAVRAIETMTEEEKANVLDRVYGEELSIDRLRSFEDISRKADALVDPKTRDYFNTVRKELAMKSVRLNLNKTIDLVRWITLRPYKFLADNNPIIEYQGKGRHLDKYKREKQALNIHSLGVYELKGLSPTGERGFRPTVKFTPAKNVMDELGNKVKVVDQDNGKR